MSRDLDRILAGGPCAVCWKPGNESDPLQVQRERDAPLDRYTIGLARIVSGLQATARELGLELELGAESNPGSASFQRAASCGAHSPGAVLFSLRAADRPDRVAGGGLGGRDFTRRAAGVQFPAFAARAAGDGRGRPAVWNDSGDRGHSGTEGKRGQEYSAASFSRFWRAHRSRWPLPPNIPACSQRRPRLPECSWVPETLRSGGLSCAGWSGPACWRLVSAGVPRAQSGLLVQSGFHALRRDRRAPELAFRAGGRDAGCRAGVGA